MKDHSIIIRRAVAADAAMIADLSRDTFYETFSQYNSKENMDKFMEEQFTRELLMAEVISPDNIFLIAEQNGAAAGYVRLRQNNTPPTLEDKDAVELARIYVRQSIVGKGVGKMLMEQCIRIAESLSANLIWLGVWEQNSRAIRFYEGLGFKTFARHTFWLGNDPQEDLLMKLVLPKQS